MATGMLDLEKELRCWICIDVLYQPLTVLDCLHTFCGSCLKEWFCSQGKHSSSSWPYTCPTCRAIVRDTRQNATVQTLVDLFTQASPGRGKSEEEKAEMRKRYKPGDKILPTLSQRHPSPDAQESEADRRLLEEVRELSLRDSGPGHRGAHEPRERRSRQRTRDVGGGPGRHRRDQDETIAGPQMTLLNYRPSVRRHDDISHREAPVRQVEHQNSLRSLISGSDIDSQEIEEEIMRQIAEEGLLDGLDLENIDASQEDEISERIAQAYRARRRSRLRHAQGRPADNNAQPSQQTRNNGPATRSHHAESENMEFEPVQLSGPPISRPYLFDVEGGSERHHGRSTSHGSNNSTSRVEASSRHPYEFPRAAARSATDLSRRPDTVTAMHGGRRRLSHQDRRNTDTELRQPQDLSQGISAGSPSQTISNSPGTTAFRANLRSASDAQTTVALSGRPANDLAAETAGATAPTRPTNQSTPSLSSAQPANETLEAQAASTLPSTQAFQEPRQALFPEPSVSCDRCQKTHIEYDLHYNCPKCHHGNFNLCLRCYRQGKGCDHWSGFGKSAWRRYEREAPPTGYPPGYPLPHVLVGHRYIRPRSPATQPATSGEGPTLTDEDPKTRLQAGLFCDICFSFASDACWRCDSCNDGEWGFCNTCVNQGRCCTHPLLPVAHKSTSAASRFGKPASAPSTIGLDADAYRPLAFSTACDICKYPVPPSHTRFHCPRCNNGDYDICTSCYLQLVSSGRISSENGHQGWRRCLRGHRMIVVGFEDREGGQTRVIVRDLVGGHALKEDANSLPTASASGGASTTALSWRWRNEDGSIHKRNRQSLTNVSAAASQQQQPQQQQIPPSGGIGMRVVALWSYWPEDGATDELSFPRGAEIREVENINGDWFWGVCAGASGVFPSNHGRVIG